MIEQKTIYYCDGCGERIETKIEPSMYCFENMRISVMLCDKCKERLKKWCEKWID